MIAGVSKKFSISVWAAVFVLLLSVVKFMLHQWGLEFFAVNALFSSAVAGAVFIIGFVLSGIIADYKEAERIPAEFRSALENIWEEGKFFNRDRKNFDLVKLRLNLQEVIDNFFRGIGHEGDHYNLQPCVDSINELSESFGEMEKLGMPPNYVVRLEGEQAALRRLALRVYHIQRTQFLPSAHILAEALVFGVISLMLLLKTEGSPESFFLFGFISFLFLYIRKLIRTIEKPFREDHKSMDDVSLYLLREFRKQLDTKGT